MNRIILDRIYKINKIYLLIILLFPHLALSQTNIKIYIDNQQDSVLYFSKYRTSKIITVDTLYINKGIFQIKQKTKLSEGIYLLLNKYDFPITEILIGKDQKFKLIINDLDKDNPIKVRGCKETSNYIKMMADKDADLNQFSVKRKDAFINLVINSMLQHDFEHYWDGFPLNDKRVLTYPLIDNKLEAYFEVLPVNSEIINDEIDKLIARAGDCVEVRDYLIWYFYRKYYNPKYMNLDDVYIHLVDEYFLKLEMENVSESVMNMMADRAHHLENLKLGAKLPNIGNLHSIESEYITVIFYDKTCQKCMNEGRVLEEIQKRHPEMAIFPVEINSTDVKNLLSLYDIQTTPMIYVLDKDKHIIAKRIKAEQVEQVLNMD